MFDRPSGGDRAVLVGVDLGRPHYAEEFEELKLLAGTAGAECCAIVEAKRSRPDAALFIGSGKAEEIRDILRAENADLAIFNHELSPAQQRNLEKFFEARVVDRTSLILDIFASRAQSHEGKLQVELAQLEHLSTRLIRGWTHLERQKGGIGLRGPGETQLESDRRLIGERVKLLKIRLEKLGRQREVQRRARARSGVFSISLVGYTNAGKSTLFNTLTHADAYAADQLFATLDTTSRRVFLPEVGQVVLSDTVGFIRELPHALIAAFRATLEETVHADLLLHVVDASSASREEQVAEVGRVLEEIGAQATPQLLVWNKIDNTVLNPGVERDDCGKLCRLRLSARTGAGLGDLRAAIAEIAATAKARNRGDNASADHAASS